MKKFIALMLVFAALTLSACSSATENEDTVDTADSTDSAVIETESEEIAPETEYTRPKDEAYVDYRNVHLISEPIYDAAAKTMVLYFEDYEVWYPENSECYVAYVSDEAANSIPSVPDFTSRPDIKLENGDYKGVVLKMEEPLPSGDYEIVVSFHTYTCSFDMTVE